MQRLVGRDGTRNLVWAVILGVTEILLINVQAVDLSLKVEKVWEKRVIGNIQQVFLGETLNCAVATSEKIYFLDPDGRVESEISCQHTEQINLIDHEKYVVLGPMIHNPPRASVWKFSVFDRHGAKVFERDKVPVAGYFAKKAGVLVAQTKTIYDQRMHFYDAQGRLIQEYNLRIGSIILGALSPQENFFAALVPKEQEGSKGPWLVVHDLQGKILWEKNFPNHVPSTGSDDLLTISPNGKFLVCRLYPHGKGKFITSLFSAEGALLKSWEGLRKPYYTPDSTALILVGEGTTQMVDLTTLQSISKLPLSPDIYINMRNVSADNQWIVSKKNDRPQTYVLAKTDGSVVYDLNLPQDLTSPASVPQPLFRLDHEAKRFYVALGNVLTVWEMKRP